MPLFRIALLAAPIFAGSLLAGSAISQEKTLNWRMNSVLHPKLFGESGTYFAERVRQLSGGSLVIEVHDRMVLDQNTFAALESGLVDAVWGSAGHHYREDPALTIFGGFPFGPDPAGFTAWMKEGGGAAALDAIYARHGLKSLYCGALPAEGGGWFTKPIAGPEDLDGLAIRSFGYGGRVLRKLGAIPYDLPAGEIRLAFEAGLISAAEFSLPSIDFELGIAEITGHLYFPGWQQPATPLEVLMSAQSWASLSDHHKTAIRAACSDTIAWAASVAVVEQIDALARFRALGVELHSWPKDTLVALRQAWEEVIAEDTARDPLFANVWHGYREFQRGYSDWETRAYVD